MVMPIHCHTLKQIPFLLLLIVSCNAFCQEKTIKRRPDLHTPKDPKKVVTRAIEAINNIRNVAYICEHEHTLPYMPTTWGEPYISKEFDSVNKADTIQGANREVYVLKDSFKLHMVYDGTHLLEQLTNDDDKLTLMEVSKDPFTVQRMIGPMHLICKLIIEEALKRKAEIEVVESGDTLRTTYTFNNLQLDIWNVKAVMEKDSIGFVSTYIIYLDKYTHLPLKVIRKMPYQTTVETILYQKVNYADTVVISALNHGQQTSLPEISAPKTDSLLRSRLSEHKFQYWKLREVEGDTIQFTTLKGKSCIIVFNSIGWKPCVDAIPFLKQLRNEYAQDQFALVSIEPFINNVEALKNYKQQHQMNYPLLITNASIKKHYPLSEVPVFIIVDKQGVVKDIVTGFRGKETEVKIRQLISVL